LKTIIIIVECAEDRDIDVINGEKIACATKADCPETMQYDFKNQKKK